MAQIIDPTVPLGTDAVSLGDDQIRALKQAIIDILGVDHDVVASPTTSSGKHKGITGVGTAALNIDTGGAFDLVLKRNAVTKLTVGATAVTLADALISLIVDSGAASDLLLKRNGTTKLTVGASAITLVDALITLILDSGAASDLLLKRNGVTKVTIANALVTLVDGLSVPSITGMTTPLSIAQGGTANATANAALNALLPAQAGNANKFLKTDATNTSWAAAGLSWGGGVRVDPTTAGDAFISCNGGMGSITESDVQVPMPYACTARNLYVRASSIHDGITTQTLRMRKNGVNTALLVTIAAGAQTGSDVANSVSFVAGDLLSFSYASAGNAAGKNLQFGYEVALS